jgi:excisionase family DNA binding protein
MGSFHNSPEPIAPRLLRTGEAARYLGMGSKAIRSLIMSRQVPYVQMRPGNSPFLLDRRDLDKFIDSHKTPAVQNSHTTG